MKNKSLPDLIREIEEQGVIDAFGEGVSIQDRDYKILYQNRLHKNLIGDHRGEFCYRAYERREKTCEGCPLTATFQDGNIHRAERSTLTERGREHFEITSSPIQDSERSIIAGIEIVKNITERKEIEKTMIESESRYRSLVESTDDSIYLVDRNYQYIFMNKKHMTRLGLLGKQFMEQPYSHFHTPKETKSFTEKVDHAFSTGESSQYEYKSHRDGKYFFQTFSPVKKENGERIAVTVVSKEITSLKKMEDKLRILSFTDELTGLHNRRGFFALAEQQLKQATREKKRRFLLSADLDNLKTINDTMGHKEGDLVLLESAIILKKSFRDSDIIARIGGDEFVILATETQEASIESLTTRLIENINTHNAKSNKSYNLSLSFGLTHFDPENATSVDELLSKADSLMYEQKKKKQKAK
jgi:diguanylate cyclase (GGDEF)-like protein/PAS domain S-box-containing protein